MKLQVCGFVIAVAVAAGAAASESSVLGGSGEIYSVTASSVDAAGGTGDGEPVLALSIRNQDGDEQSVVVPGTEGPDYESSPFVAFERTSQTLFIIWESRQNIHTSIHLIGYRDGEWTDPLNISGGGLSWKSTPRLAVTREVYARPHETDVVEESRTILHVVWNEASSRGHVLRYAPVILVDGRYVGAHSLLTFDDLVAPGLAPPWEFEATVPPVLTPAPNGLSVTIGAVVPSTGLFTTIRVGILEADLASLADDVESWLIANEEGYGDLRLLADGMRGHMIDFGARVGNDIISRISDGMRGHMIDFGARHEGDVRRIAREMRGHMIDFGLTVDSRGLRRAPSSVVAASAVDLLDPETILVMEGTPEPPLPQIGRFSVIVQQALTGLEESGDPLVLMSADGRDLAYAWQVDDDHLAYRLGNPAGDWQATQQITLGPRLDRSTALRLLQEKIDRN